MVEQTGHDLYLSKGKVKSMAKDVTGARISDDAVLRAIYESENELADVFELAKELAHHAGRKTIQEEDVRMAYRVKDQ